MSITNFEKIFIVGENEYGYSSDKFLPIPSGKTINMYVPKLMGAITSIGTESITINGLFANDAECKPTYTTKVKKTNYMAVKLKDNCNWLNKINSDGYIEKGTKFTVEFLNANIASPFTTTK